MKEKAISEEQFAEEMKVKCTLCLPAEYAAKCALGECMVQFRKTEGGWRLYLSDGDNHVAEPPHLSLRTVYESCGYRFDTKIVRSILKQYVKQYEQALRKEQEEKEKLEKFMSRFPEEKIVTLLVPNGTDGKIAQFPGTQRGSAFQLYCVLRDSSKMEAAKEAAGLQVSAVTKELMECWQINENDLCLAAEKYMPLTFPYQICELGMLMGGTGYVISTAAHSFGTGTLFYKEGPLKEIAMECLCDLYLFPLSVHEVAVFPVNCDLTEAETSALADKVSPFGADVWYYNKELNMLAFSQKERFLQGVMQKDGILDAAERMEENGINR